MRFDRASTPKGEEIAKLLDGANNLGKKSDELVLHRLVEAIADDAGVHGGERDEENYSFIQEQLVEYGVVFPKNWTKSDWGTWEGFEADSTPVTEGLHYFYNSWQ